MRKERIEKSFNSAAPHYDTYAHVQKDSAKRLACLITSIADLIAPTTILDIGTGTGFVPEALVSHFPRALYTLNDIAPHMLRTAAAKLSGKASLSTHLGDAEHTPFPNAPYDLITANLSLQWFAHLEEGLANLWRQGNALAFSTLTAGTFSSWAEAHRSRDVSCGLHPYPTREALKGFCDTLGADITLYDSQSYDSHFESGRAFIDHLRLLGAATPQADYLGAPLRSILKDFSHGLTANYEIFYAVLIKKKRG